MTARLVAALASTLALSACLAGGSRGPCRDGSPISTICGFRNPEDIEFIRSADVLLVSNMRTDAETDDGGFLSALILADDQVLRIWPPEDGRPGIGDPSEGSQTCPGPPAPDAFYPHGLTSREFDDTTLVYVVGHRGRAGGREAIEIFALSGRGARTQLTWVGCIPTRQGIQANDAAVTSEGELVVSDYQPDGSLRHMLAAALLGRDTGEIQVWNETSGWRTVAGTTGKLPNGVAISARQQMLFYSETLAGALHRRPLGQPAGAVTITIPGHPDNLSWTSSGNLLLASHTGGPAFLFCQLGMRPCRASWAIHEIDPDTMAVRPVLEHDGSVIGAVATAVEANGRMYLSSVFDDRIGFVALHQGRNPTGFRLR